MNEKEIITRSLETTGSILQGHFLLTSGRHSGFYVQCAKLFVNPADSERLCGLLCRQLQGINAEYVVSPALGGVIMGYEMARCMGIKNFFAERINGAMELRRGFELPQGARVIVAEDVVTTGGSVREVIELVRTLGGVPKAVAAIVDRSSGSVDFGVPFYSLLQMDIASYKTEECPICKAGNIPIHKQGSRR